MSNGDINDVYSSRLYDANEANPSAENGDFTDWDIADEFILCCCIWYYPAANQPTDAEQVKVQFSEDGGDWTDVGAGQAIAPGSNTTLTNGSSVTQRITVNVPSAAANGFEASGVEVEGTGTSNSITIGDEYYTEVHFALDPALANAGSTYTFRLYNTTNNTPLLINGVATSIPSSISIYNSEINLTGTVSTVNDHSAIRPNLISDMKMNIAYSKHSNISNLTSILLDLNLSNVYNINHENILSLIDLDVLSNDVVLTILNTINSFHDDFFEILRSSIVNWENTTEGFWTSTRDDEWYGELLLDINSNSHGNSSNNIVLGISELINLIVHNIQHNNLDNIINLFEGINLFTNGSLHNGISGLIDLLVDTQEINLSVSPSIHGNLQLLIDLLNDINIIVKSTRHYDLNSLINIFLNYNISINYTEHKNNSELINLIISGIPLVVKSIQHDNLSNIVDLQNGIILDINSSIHDNLAKLLIALQATETAWVSTGDTFWVNTQDDEWYGIVLLNPKSSFHNSLNFAVLSILSNNILEIKNIVHSKNVFQTNILLNKLINIFSSIHEDNVDNELTLSLVGETLLELKNSLHQNNTEVLNMMLGNSLLVKNIYHDLSTETISQFSIDYLLSVLSSMHSNDLVTISLLEDINLNINSAVHDGFFSLLELYLQGELQLSINDTFHGKYSNIISLIKQISLVLKNTKHDSYNDIISILKQIGIDIDNVVHDNKIEIISLLKDIQLGLNNSVHNSAESIISVNKQLTLDTDNTKHNNLIDVISLLNSIILNINNTIQSNIARIITLYLQGEIVLSLNRSSHDLLLNTVSNALDAHLNIQNGIHYHLINLIELFIPGVIDLVVNDIFHENNSNIINLSLSRLINSISGLHNSETNRSEEIINILTSTNDSVLESYISNNVVLSFLNELQLRNTYHGDYSEIPSELIDIVVSARNSINDFISGNAQINLDLQVFANNIAHDILNGKLDLNVSGLILIALNSVHGMVTGTPLLDVDVVEALYHFLAKHFNYKFKPKNYNNIIRGEMHNGGNKIRCK